MASTLDYISTHRGGIVMLLVMAFGVVGIVQWLAWIFRRGRFALDDSDPRDSATKLGVAVADFFVKLINDFRHLLALVIVSVFGLALAGAMYPGLRHWNVDEIGKGVQAVAAALGGLIGSIVGYYFGESAATQRAATAPAKDVTPVQTPPVPAISAIVEAPPPPSASIGSGPPTT
jgi:hypothetical protein